VISGPNTRKCDPFPLMQQLLFRLISPPSLGTWGRNPPCHDLRLITVHRANLLPLHCSRPWVRLGCESVCTHASAEEIAPGVRLHAIPPYKRGQGQRRGGCRAGSEGQGKLRLPSESGFMKSNPSPIGKSTPQAAARPLSLCDHRRSVTDVTLPPQL
jgi:hypothetical protein